jgi:hypothetical protein
MTTDSAECKRFGAEKTAKHLLWECSFSQLAWKNLNTILEEKQDLLGQVSRLQKREGQKMCKFLW